MLSTDQLQRSEYNYAVAAGTDTYTVVLIPSLQAYKEGLFLRIKFTNGNTGASTLNVNGLGALSIVKQDGSALSSGDIQAGKIYSLNHDGTNLVILGGAGTGFSGSGFANRITKWSDASTLTTGILLDDGTQIKLDSGKFISSQDETKSQIDFGTTGSEYVFISSDGGTGNEGYLFFDPSNSFTQLGFAAAQMDIRIYGDVASGGVTGAIISKQNNINTAASSDDDRTAVLIGTRNSTMNTGVTNSVIVGGVGLTGDQDDTLFAEELRFTSSLGTTVISDVSSGASILFDVGTNDDVTLSTDNGTLATAFITLDTSNILLANPVGGFTTIQADGVNILFGDTSQTKIRGNPTLDLLSDSVVVGKIGDNTGSATITADVDVTRSLILASRNATFNQNVTNSVILGGVGLTADKDDTVYVPNLNLTGNILLGGATLDASPPPSGIIAVRTGIAPIVLSPMEVDVAQIYVDDHTGDGTASLHVLNEEGDVMKFFADSGWSDPTGTSDKSTFDTSTVTTADLAEFVKAMYEHFKAMGFFKS